MPKQLFVLEGQKKEYKVQRRDCSSCHEHRGIEEGRIFPTRNQIQMPTSMKVESCGGNISLKKKADTKLT